MPANAVDMGLILSLGRLHMQWGNKVSKQLLNLSMLAACSLQGKPTSIRSLPLQLESSPGSLQACDPVAPPTRPFLSLTDLS